MNQNLINWHATENAKEYAAFCKQNQMYKKAGAALVELANIAPGEIILDYACGTGAATEAIVEKCDASNKIYAIDYSKAQIEQAQAIQWPEFVSFFQGDERTLSSLISEKVNVVICSNAFWFLNIPQLLASIEKIAAPQCRIVFDLFGDPLPRKKEVSISEKTKGLLQIAEDLAVKEFGYQANLEKPSASWYARTTQDYVEWFDKSAFTITCLKARTGKHSPLAGGYEWWKIPVFLTSHLPGLSYDQALIALEKAQDYLSKNPGNYSEAARVKELSWIYLAEMI